MVCNDMKMVMDKEKLVQITKAAQIRIPDDEMPEVLGRVNDIFSVCAVVGELDCTGVPDFSWEIRKHPKRRPDIPETWTDRDRFMSEAPTHESDFFRVPRIATEE